MSLGQVIVDFDHAESINSGVLVSGSPGVAWFKSDWWHVRLRLMPEVCLDVLTGHTPFSKLAALLPLTSARASARTLCGVDDGLSSLDLNQGAAGNAVSHVKLVA